MAKVQHKRGLKANLPSASLYAGELFLTTDRHTAHFPTDATTMNGIVPAIDDLTTLAAIDLTSDLLIVHDADGTGVKEKKITGAALKAAFNIPASSTDEKVAAVSGGTSGYLFGTDGTNGVLRVDSTLSMTKDSGNAFVTIGFNSVDCGTF